MLQMRRAPFFALVKTFKDRGLLEDNIHTSMEHQAAVFFLMLWVITRGLE
jgi:hypothetical protein